MVSTYSDILPDHPSFRMLVANWGLSEEHDQYGEKGMA